MAPTPPDDTEHHHQEDHRVRMHHVTWAQLQTVLAIRGDDASFRIT